MPFWPTPIQRDNKLREFTLETGRHILEMLVGQGPTNLAPDVKESIEQWAKDNPHALVSRHALWTYISNLEQLLRNKYIAKKNVYNFAYLHDTWKEPPLDS